MKKFLALVISSFLAFNSYALTANAAPLTLAGYLEKSIMALDKKGYKVSYPNGTTVDARNMYGSQGEMILTGGNLKGIEVHVKIVDGSENEVPSAVLAAYRPNKQRIAMTKIEFQLEKSYEKNRIALSRSIKIFLKQIQEKLYVEHKASNDSRLPAQEEEDVAMDRSGDGSAILMVILFGVGVMGMLAVAGNSYEKNMERTDKEEWLKEFETGRENYQKALLEKKKSRLDARHAKLSALNKANKLEKSIKALAIEKEAQKLVISKNNINQLIKLMGSKRAKVLMILVTIGLSLNYFASEKMS